MAEALCRKLLQERGLCGDVTLGSAGIGNSCGNRRPAVILREFLAGLGIDVAAHRSKPLTEEIAGSADLIFPVTRRQERKILATFPSIDKTVPALFLSADIRKCCGLPSPFKRDCPLSRNCRQTEIERRGAFDATMLVGMPVLNS